jgi:hypothetical protein
MPGVMLAKRLRLLVNSFPRVLVIQWVYGSFPTAKWFILNIAYNRNKEF